MSQQDHYESWESDEINLTMHEVNENTGKKHKKKKKASKKSRKDKDITEPTSPEPTPERTGEGIVQGATHSDTDKETNLYSITEAQERFLNTLIDCSPSLKIEKVHQLTSHFQSLNQTSLRLLEENAILRGRIIELEKRVLTKDTNNMSRPTYAQALKDAPTENDDINKDKTYPDTQSYSNQIKASSHQQTQKRGLIIYPAKPTTKASHFVRELIKATFSPTDFGLREPVLREVRDGVLVLSDEGQGLEKLREAIKNHPKTSDILLSREPKERKPQFIVSGVDAEVKESEITSSLVQQNKLEAQPTEIKIMQKFNHGSTSTIIIETEPKVFQQLKEKKKVLLGWTSCPMRENLYLPRCNRCLQIGHTYRHCTNSVRCNNCSGTHEEQDCENNNPECLNCKESNRKWNTNFDSNHKASDTNCPVYLTGIRKLKSRTTYN